MVIVFWILVLPVVAASGGVVDVNQSDFDPVWDSSWLYRGLPPVPVYKVIQYPLDPRSPWEAWEWELTVDARNTSIHLVCLDQDLPPNSNIKIWSDPHSSRPIGGVLSYGRLARHVLQLDRGYLRVLYEPHGHFRSEEYAGFRCIVWFSHPDPLSGRPSSFDHWSPFPRTDCPVVSTDRRRGGVVHVGRQNRNDASEVEYFYDCVWVLKPPRKSNDTWFVYIRVTELDLDGFLEIRRGISSQSPILAAIRHQSGLRKLKQPEEGFVSSTGLYVRLIKRFNISEMRLVYGAFTLVSEASIKSIKSDHRCSSGQKAGFRCKAAVGGSYWCVPGSNLCDDVGHCPDNSDEIDQSCKKQSNFIDNDIVRKPFSTVRCKNSSAKFCVESRSCVPLTSRCPSDPCPEVTQLVCDGGHTCYSPADICDGIPVCSDHSDEQACNNVGIFGSPLLLAMWVILTLVVLLLFAGVLYVMCLRRRRFSPITSTEDNTERMEECETANADL